MRHTRGAEGARPAKRGTSDGPAPGAAAKLILRPTLLLPTLLAAAPPGSGGCGRGAGAAVGCDSNATTRCEGRSTSETALCCCCLLSAARTPALSAPTETGAAVAAVIASAVTVDSVGSPAGSPTRRGVRGDSNGGSPLATACCLRRAAARAIASAGESVTTVAPVAAGAAAIGACACSAVAAVAAGVAAAGTAACGVRGPLALGVRRMPSGVRCVVRVVARGDTRFTVTECLTAAAEGDTVRGTLTDGTTVPLDAAATAVTADVATTRER